MGVGEGDTCRSWVQGGQTLKQGIRAQEVKIAQTGSGLGVNTNALWCYRSVGCTLQAEGTQPGRASSQIMDAFKLLSDKSGEDTSFLTFLKQPIGM